MITENRPVGTVVPAQVKTPEAPQVSNKIEKEIASADEKKQIEISEKNDLNKLLSTPEGRESFKSSIEELNKHIKIFNSQMAFSFDEDSGKTVITISNKETEEIIRKIPPEEILKLSAKFREVIGTILDETV